MQELLVEFMTVMSVAHECLATERGDKIVYQGQSPDEITLVEFAKTCGFEFIASTDTWAAIQTSWDFRPGESKLTYMNDDVSQPMHSQMGITHTLSEVDMMDFDRSNNNIKHPKRLQAEEQEQHFVVESRMDFSSDRKRMSILVRDPKDEKFKLYIKGADTEIKKRMKPGVQDPNIVASVDRFVDDSTKEGLRTLLFAMRVLDEDEVHNFQIELEDIQTSLENIDERVEKLYSNLENNLTLIGATALEDRLQENVPDVINDIQQANIKVWMLTGDQFNTAENIAKSCKLIQDGFEVYKLRTREQVEHFCSEEFIQQNEEMMAQNKKRALIVEAPALLIITEKPELEINFIRISKTCEAVVCCRVSPKQKAEVVRMIKQDDTTAITLAIGDGANDVSMINEAHIGIGIYGNEGLSAVQSADYGIPEFQTLRRLILVHGRTRYLSVSSFIMYFFYKNCVLTMPQFYFAYLSGFSALNVFDDFYVNLYNTFFTCLPCVMLGVFYWDIMPDCDQDILLPEEWTTEQVDSEMPDWLNKGPRMNDLLTKLYYVGQLRKGFNTKNFVWMEAQGIFDAAVIFFIPFFHFQQFGGQILNEDSHGQTADQWVAVVASFTAMVLVVHSNILTRLRYSTYIHAISITFLSIFLYLIYMWIGNYPEFSQTRFAVLQAHNSPNFYLSIACCIGICFAVDYMVYAWQVLITKSPADFLRQKIYQRETLDEASYAEFKQLVAKEESDATVKLNQQRKLTDMRQMQLFELQQSQTAASLKSLAPFENKKTEGRTPSNSLKIAPQQSEEIGQNSLNSFGSKFESPFVRHGQVSQQAHILDSEDASVFSDVEPNTNSSQLHLTAQKISSRSRPEIASAKHSLSMDGGKNLMTSNIFKRNEFVTIDESAYEEDGPVDKENLSHFEQFSKMQQEQYHSIEPIPQKDSESEGGRQDSDISIGQMTEQLDQLSIHRVHENSALRKIRPQSILTSQDHRSPKHLSTPQAKNTTSVQQNNFVRDSYDGHKDSALSLRYDDEDNAPETDAEKVKKNEKQ